MSPNDDVELRRLGPEEKDRLFAFYRQTMDSAERVIALYEWRLSGRPDSGGVDTFVAVIEGRIVGAMNAAPIRLSSEGELLEAAWQQDSIVHPNARGRGIGSRLVSYAAAQTPIALAKGTVEPMYRLRKKAGFADVPRDTFLLRPTTPLPGSNASSKRRVLFPALWLAGRIASNVPTGLETTEIARFDASFDGLAETLAERTELRVYKPSGYLNWRYFNCPVRSYRVYAAVRGGEPAGAIVLRTDEDRRRDEWIVDLVVDETDSFLVQALLNVALRVTAGSPAPAVRTFATSPRLRRLLVLRGFVPTSETPRFTYHLSVPGSTSPAGCWNFFHGDGDTELLD